MLLEKILRKLLNEAAKTIQDAVTNGLNLFLEEQGGHSRLVLYRTEIMDDYRNFHPVAYIHFENEEESCGSWVVSSVVAEKGYGPLIYDIAMSVIYPSYIRADNMITADAKSIWGNMLGAHAAKYESIPIDPSENCKTGLSAQMQVKVKRPLDYDLLFDTTLEGHEKSELIWLGRNFFGNKYKKEVKN